MENTPDLGSLISTLSNNPALMGVLSELMKNSGSAPPPPPLPAPQPTAAAQGVSAAGGIDPELIGSLLSLLGQGSATTAHKPPEPPKNEPPRGAESTENILSKLLGGKSESENRIRLLNALRPYLGEERREKLDLILKLLKLAELGHLSGLLSSV